LGYHSAAELGSLAERLRRLELIRVDSVETLNDPGKQQLLLSLGYTAILALPTRTRTGEVIILSCVHCSFSRQWTNDQVELLQAVMAQLAIAVTHAELYEKTRTKAQELEQALGELQRTQTQLVQSEKMSSLGQLVAGVAHEINNPVSFISGNVGHASDYVKDLLRLLELYRATYPQSTAEIQALAEEIELDFLMEDLPKVIDSMKVGATRIEKIVGSLRTFSRVDQSDRKPVNLHEDLDNTLLILEHRLKATGGHPQIEVIKEYGNLPPVECYAAQMNQVFMNLLSNAIDAIEEAQQQATKGNTEESGLKPKLAIKTQIVDTNCVSITITDNGTGIPPDVLSRMFDLFFTTKPIGKGTGLGLAISYQIIVEKHGGSLNCHSVPGKGTEFVIEIPIKQL
jgi:signal transduction histidine kinase